MKKKAKMEKIPKFKIGDVVITNSQYSELSGYPPTGSLATVEKVNTRTFGKSSFYTVYFFEEFTYGCFEYELELSPLSYSPLVEALR